MKKFIFLAISVLLMAACGSPLPQQFNAIADRVEKNGDKFTEEQWEKVNAEYDKLVEKYEAVSEKLSADERQEISSAMGRYQGAVLKAGIKQVGSALDEALEGAKGFLEGLGIKTEGEKEE
ncbi:MAG: hypothetical protein J5640_01880 [Bacteroidales bacterium]|nr:hypothetical protein [Bacteroidales bacterium]